MQEPPLHEGRIVGFASYDVFAERDARAGIVADREEKLSPCPELTDRDVAAAVWHCADGKTLLVSYYLDVLMPMSLCLDGLQKAAEYADRNGTSGPRSP